MSYEEAFSAAWASGGHAGALDFLRSIFHAPENQKIQGAPTDYLNDEDDEQLPPSAGFDRMIREFGHRSRTLPELVSFIAECLEESRGGDSDQMHRIQPFNSLVGLVGTYGHGDADLRSVHVSGDSWKAQYHLHHTVIDEFDNYDPDLEDADDGYDFIYELENGDRYALKHDGEKVDGGRLFKDLRTAQYAGVLKGVGDALFADPTFAAFPKTLPFRLFVGPQSYDDGGTTESWFEVATWTESDFDDHPLREAILGSAKPLPEPTREERWVYLLGYAHDSDSAEFQNLVELLDAHEDLRRLTLELAWWSLRGRGLPPEESLSEDLFGPANAARRTSFLAWARLLWALADERDTATDYVREILERPLTELSDLEPDDVADAFEAELFRVGSAFWGAPEDARPQLRPAYESAVAAIRAVEHPVARVLFIEQELRDTHGDEAADIDRWGDVTYGVAVPSELLHGLVQCVQLLPESFSGFGGLWDFVMGRLQALGEQAAIAAPGIEALLARYAEDRIQEQVLVAFANVLYGMGVEAPPAAIREHCERKKYHMVECYKPWAERLPRLRWEGFLEAYEAEPEAFRRAATWESFLVDSDAARTMFAKGFQDHERATDLIDALIEATPDASELLAKLVSTTIDVLNKKTHKPADKRKTEQVAALLAALPERSEKQDEALRRARFLIARFDVDAGGDGGVDALLDEYPDHPFLLFIEAQLAERDDGAEDAARLTIDAVRTLSENDLVYRKAFFTFTGVTARSWDAWELVHGLVAYRWAQAHHVAKNYRDAEFAQGQGAVSNDPFYDGLVQVAAKLDAAGRRDAWREAAVEIEFGSELQTLANDELADRLTADSWNITYQICQRLVPEHKEFGERLLEAYAWFREDESRRLALASLYWPHEDFRPALLRAEQFDQDLVWLVRRYPGIGATEMARLVITTLLEIGEGRRALALAKELPAQNVMGCFLAVNAAIDALRAFDEGIELLTQMRDEMSPKKPEYMLLGSNIGVMQYRKGDAARAAANYDELFAMDWSRFDYQPPEDDFMAEIMGGNLKAQIADVFRQYFAMAKYNAACVFANVDRADDAIEALREANALIPEKYGAEKFESESDLDPLRGLEAYAELINTLGGAS